MSTYFIYIIYNKVINKYYIGHTDNIRRRLKEHNTFKKYRYTSKQNLKWQLIYTEEYTSKSEAIKRELYFKSLKNIKYLKIKLGI